MRCCFDSLPPPFPLALRVLLRRICLAPLGCGHRFHAWDRGGVSFNASSFFRARPLATRRLLSVHSSPLFNRLLRAAPRRSPLRGSLRLATSSLGSMGALRLLSSFALAPLVACPRLLLLLCKASLTLRGKSPPACLDVFKLVSSLFIPAWFYSRDTELSQVASLRSPLRGSLRLAVSASLRLTGSPCHAPLPWSRTPVDRARLAFQRHAHTGPRWVNGEDIPPRETFEAQSHGLSARCQRFVPASRLTTHDSLPAAWLQALPRGVLTRWVAT